MVAWGYNANGQATRPGKFERRRCCGCRHDWHSLALKGNGTVVAWGQGNMGQTSVPANLSNVLAIGAGSYHSVALVADTTTPDTQPPDTTITAQPDEIVTSTGASFSFSSSEV